MGIILRKFCVTQNLCYAFNEEVPAVWARKQIEKGLTCGLSTSVPISVFSSNVKAKRRWGWFLKVVSRSARQQAGFRDIKIRDICPCQGSCSITFTKSRKHAAMVRILQNLALVRFFVFKNPKYEIPRHIFFIFAYVTPPPVDYYTGVPWWQRRKLPTRMMSILMLVLGHLDIYVHHWFYVA